MANPSVELPKGLMVRMRNSVHCGEFDGLFLGDTWDQRFHVVKSFESRPNAPSKESSLIPWKTFVFTRLQWHGAHSGQGALGPLGWFAVPPLHLSSP